MTHKMNHELRAELANAKLTIKSLAQDNTDLREELGQCSRELLACSESLDEKRRKLLELTSGYEQGVAWASGKRDAVPMPAPEPGVIFHMIGCAAREGGACNKRCSETYQLPEPGFIAGTKGTPEGGLTSEEWDEEDPNLNTPEGDSDFEVMP